MRHITDGIKRYDLNGRIASYGQVNKNLLALLMKNSYLKSHPPKSAGRKQFGYEFMEKILAAAKKMDINKEDLITTATAFTAESIARAYKKFLPEMPAEMIVCGGGAHNRTLLKMLRDRLPSVTIAPMDHQGIDCDSKEAVSFAILAYATIKGITNNVPNATGASKPAILGKIIPA